MRRERTLIVATILVTSLWALIPGLAAAAPPEGSCAGERGLSFTMAVPEAMRTEGVHRFQYRITSTMPDGSLEVGYTDNQVEIATDAPIYDNVLLRLVRNRGLLPDGSVDVDVQAIRPTQRASFYAQISGLREDEALIAATVMDIRYETRKNQWTEWAALARSAMRSLCIEVNDGLLRKSFGWAG